MIEFIKNDNKLILHYTTEGFASIDFIWKSYTGKKKAIIRKIFTFSEKDLYISDDEEFKNDSEHIYFVFGILENSYYKINKESLSMTNNLYIEENIKIDIKLFMASRNISIFNKLDKLIEEDIFIGTSENCNFTIETLQELIQNFPNTYELNHYANSRIDSILSDYFSTMDNSYDKYQKYLNNKIKSNKPSPVQNIYEYEKSKYILILDQLKSMIKSEKRYTEKQWQDLILDIILLLYPKYIAAIDELTFSDVYNNTKRKLDFGLVDNDGNIDIVEIKKADIGNIISKRTYRDNFIPLKELTGTIMQVEKYIYYLQSVGKNELIKIKEKYKKLLPSDIDLKITNPQGIIIMGNSNKLSTVQKNDFEIIKRKYKNIIDIITYDDLIHRLELLVNKMYNIRYIKELNDN